MLFGLTNAPETFQRLIDRVLTAATCLYILVYLDDINVFKKFLEEHIEHSNIVLQSLEKA